MVRTLLYCVMPAVLLIACSSYAKKSITAADVAALKPEQTNRTQVESMYGRPYSSEKGSNHVRHIKALRFWRVHRRHCTIDHG